ncbi:signal peptidase I [Opitutales bacterium ASA1]|uniref:signal peptidase I n=1 Tax=Congregicoccus parvus TaxID=3081749 RepID=UPI002B2F4431|nr:signal peptidase I [Opitutales bacterium ASA1]
MGKQRYIVFILLAASVLCIGGCQRKSFVVQSRSMEPTLVPGDVVEVIGRSDNIERFDLVVFLHRPLNQFYVMRLIALPGETLELRESGLFVNDVMIESPVAGVAYRRLESLIYRYANGKKFVVPEDSIFVLGDNFTGTQDSRTFGPVNLADVVGVVSKRDAEHR